MSESIYEAYMLKARAYLYELYNGSGRLTKSVYKSELANYIVSKVSRRRQEILYRNEKYLELLANSIRATGKEVIEVLVKTKSRLLVNVASPFGWLIDEVGIDWDPILDTPSILESTIKGVVSAALQIKSLMSHNDYKFLRDILLGISTKEEKRVSLIDFTKALPVDVNNDSQLLERDVITPIYSQDKIEEHKAEPTPIQFLVVPPGVTFKFLVIIDRPRIIKMLPIIKESLSQITSENAIKRIKEDIIAAIKFGFSEIGVGAKTSSGYGIFDVISVNGEGK